MKYNQIIFILGAIMLSVTCSFQEYKEYSLPQGYSYEKSKKYFLPSELNEVSGILWLKQHVFICIQDEKGTLYKVDISQKKILDKSKFEGSADIEAVTQYNDTYYCLKSDGDIYVIQNAFKENSKSKKINFPFKGQNDFETLLLTEDSDNLYIICKNCKGDKNSESSSFSFNLFTQEISKTDKWSVKRPDFVSSKIRIKPSDATQHPITKDIYIISHSSKWIMVYDKSGEFKSFHNLDPKVFAQPEGIAFNNKGDMFISNEAAGGSPDIIEFPFNPK
ncbi:SdiA-regulated domain-containing protein [Marinigracilibium pacificum]|uniref:SdiA-regulated protein n=1 Tax=Marinigracilibium pacificum TaxID=2729599 RepID=A0A848J500_9BACT|nr:SdiA-regulated domain-containing protein [Marinigracilibium pacificum]NMM48232.1 hypothetical protein [Marinigracilibium pacificum]